MSVHRWSGWFQQSGIKFKVIFNELEIVDQDIEGKGYDKVGRFTLKGSVVNNSVKFTKTYTKKKEGELGREIQYSGILNEENGEINGTWKISDSLQDKFFIKFEGEHSLWKEKKLMDHDMKKDFEVFCTQSEEEVNKKWKFLQNLSNDLLDTKPLAYKHDIARREEIFCRLEQMHDKTRELEGNEFAWTMGLQIGDVGVHTYLYRWILSQHGSDAQQPTKFTRGFIAKTERVRFSSSNQPLHSVAVYDSVKREFNLHLGSVVFTKDMFKHGFEKGIVFARLVVNKQEKGVHAFIVDKEQLLNKKKRCRYDRRASKIHHRLAGQFQVAGERESQHSRSGMGKSARHSSTSSSDSRSSSSSSDSDDDEKAIDLDEDIKLRFDHGDQNELLYEQVDSAMVELLQNKYGLPVELLVKLDSDKNGKISKEELTVLLRQLRAYGDCKIDHNEASLKNDSVVSISSAPKLDYQLTLGEESMLAKDSYFDEEGNYKEVNSSNKLHLNMLLIRACVVSEGPREAMMALKTAFGFGCHNLQEVQHQKNGKDEFEPEPMIEQQGFRTRLTDSLATTVVQMVAGAWLNTHLASQLKDQNSQKAGLSEIEFTNHVTTVLKAHISTDTGTHIEKAKAHCGQLGQQRAAGFRQISASLEPIQNFEIDEALFLNQANYLFECISRVEKQSKEGKEDALQFPLDYLSKRNAEAAKPKTKAESFNFKRLVEKHLVEQHSHQTGKDLHQHQHELTEKELEELVDGLEKALRARVFVKMEFLISAINREKSKLNSIIKQATNPNYLYSSKVSETQNNLIDDDDNFSKFNQDNIQVDDPFKNKLKNALLDKLGNQLNDEQTMIKMKLEMVRTHAEYISYRIFVDRLKQSTFKNSKTKVILQKIFLISAINDLLHDSGHVMTAKYFDYPSLRPMSIWLERFIEDIRPYIVGISSCLTQDLRVYSKIKRPDKLSTQEAKAAIGISEIVKNETEFDYLLHRRKETTYLAAKQKDSQEKDRISFFGIRYDQHTSEDIQRREKIVYVEGETCWGSFMDYYNGDEFKDYDDEWDGELAKISAWWRKCWICSLLWLFVILIIVALVLTIVAATKSISVSGPDSSKPKPVAPTTTWVTADPENYVKVSWEPFEYKDWYDGLKNYIQSPEDVFITGYKVSIRANDGTLHEDTQNCQMKDSLQTECKVEVSDLMNPNGQFKLTWGDIVQAQVQVVYDNEAVSPVSDLGGDAKLVTVSDPPTNLGVIDTRRSIDGTVGIQWLKPTNLGGYDSVTYNVYFKKEGETFKEAVYDDGEKICREIITECHIPYGQNQVLQLGNTYTFAVKAVNAYGVSDYSNVYTVYAGKAPEPPKGLVMNNVGDKVEINWNVYQTGEDGGAEVLEYVLKVASQSGAYIKFEHCTDLLTRFCSIPQSELTSDPLFLEAGKRVKIQLTAINGYGESKPASNDNAVVYGLPDAPINLSNNLAFTDASRIGLSWDQGSNPSSTGYTAVLEYEVEQMGQNSQFAQIGNTVGQVKTWSTEAAVVRGSTNTFRVRARNAIGYSQYSIQLAVLAAGVPSAPVSIGTQTTPGSEKATESVVISFVPPSDNGGSAVTGYELEIKNARGNFDKLIWPTCQSEELLAKNACEVPVSHFRPNYQLDWGNQVICRIWAINSVGKSLSATVGGEAILLNLPGPVQDLDTLPSGTSSDKVAIQWKAPESNGGKPIQNYEIWLAEGTSQIFTKIGQTSELTYQKTSGVTGGNQYKFKVFALTSVGTCSESMVVQVQSSYPPDKPINLGIDYDQTKQNYLVLTWDKGGSQPVDFYTVYKQAEGEAIWEVQVDRAESTTTNFAPVNIKVVYKYSVVAVSSQGRSERSDPKAISMEQVANTQCQTDSLLNVVKQSTQGKTQAQIAEVDQKGVDTIRLCALYYGVPRIDINLLSGPMNALKYTAFWGYPMTAKELILNNAELNNDAAKATAVYIAAMRRQPEIAIDLIKAGADVSILNQKAQGAALYAAVNDLPTVIEAIQNVSNTYPNVLNDVTINGQFPLFIAVQKSNLDSVIQLVNSPSVKINQRFTIDGSQRTALYLACSSIDYSVEIVQALLKHPQIDVNAENADENTPLIWASWHNDQVEKVKELVKMSSINLNHQNNLKQTAFYASVYSNSVDVFDFLLNQPGVDLNKQDESGNSPLICAAMYGFKDKVKALKDKSGVQLNLTDNNGQTALMIVKANLEANIYPAYMDQPKKNFLTTQQKTDYQEIIEMLSEV